jgi:hypothetical protein
MESPGKFKCMDVESWRAFTKQEMRTYLEEMGKRTDRKDEGPHYRTILAVRQKISPVDMYFYLKARFAAALCIDWQSGQRDWGRQVGRGGG